MVDRKRAADDDAQVGWFGQTAEAERVIRNYVSSSCIVIVHLVITGLGSSVPGTRSRFLLLFSTVSLAWHTVGERVNFPNRSRPTRFREIRQIKVLRRNRPLLAVVVVL